MKIKPLPLVLLPLLLCCSGALPLRASPLDDPDHPLRPLELQLGDVPPLLLKQPGRQLVLARGRRQLLLLNNGQLLARYPVAVGMAGWETPLGKFRVLEKRSDPPWSNPHSGDLVAGAHPKIPWAAVGSASIGIAESRRVLTVKRNWISRAAPSLVSMAPPTVGPWAMRFPMVACGFLRNTSRLCLIKCNQASLSR